MVVLATAFFTMACRDDPPEKEMQQAQGAIEAARAAGADQYAHDELVGAVEALKHAREAVDERDYRLALNHALDSREHAQNAAKATADNKAIARADADHALIDAAAALTEARGRARAPESSQAPAKALALRRTIADADATVQKARASFKDGDYKSVTSDMRELTGRLRGAIRDLESATAPAGRRHR
jgi:hypothetical protein